MDEIITDQWKDFVPKRSCFNRLDCQICRIASPSGYYNIVHCMSCVWDINDIEK